MGTNKKKQNEVADTLVLILQIGITMLVPIMMCTIGGAWLDNKLDTKFIGVLGFVLGAIAGFQNVYKLVKKYLKNTKSPGELQREMDEAAMKDEMPKEEK
ncbi:MAG: AtpZ/AtpI family protein [Lachnospiraceae bacterium]|nr:AtpZ/AtpI family protein [Lachnospiraceae bacterium]